jgi:hypothetical protein
LASEGERERIAWLRNIKVSIEKVFEYLTTAGRNSFFVDKTFLLLSFPLEMEANKQAGEHENI